MTLRKKEDNGTIEVEPIDSQKGEKFKQMITELAVYLGKFKSKRVLEMFEPEIVVIDDTNKYRDCVLGYKTNYSLDHYFLFIANSKDALSTNPYIKILAENIFPAFAFFEALYFDYDWQRVREYRGPREQDEKWMLPYISSAKDFWIMKENLDKVDDLELLPVTWRTDIIYPEEYENKIFSNVIKNILSQSSGDHWSEAKYYNLFWNLFALAIDGGIQNKSASAVVDLASYFGFDEHMFADWCRAVEYVLGGNKLSEHCDLECKTVEGARFFLHKDE